jgi:hypothetical protein
MEKLSAERAVYQRPMAETEHEYNINSETGGERWHIWLTDKKTGRAEDCDYKTT